jgi:hypothetical protein
MKMEQTECSETLALNFFLPMPPHVPYGHCGLPSRLWPMCNRLLRRSYVVLTRWMVIYGYEVPGGASNLNSTKLPRPWSPWGSSPSRKIPHSRTGNQTRDLIINSQKLWPLDHKAGPNTETNPKSTVGPRFTNLIRSWRPFVNRNYFSHKNQCKMD